MRGVLIAEEDNIQNYYIEKIYDAIWVDGLNLNDQNIVDKVLKKYGDKSKNFFLRSSNQNIKDLLKKKDARSFSKRNFWSSYVLCK